MPNGIKASLVQTDSHLPRNVAHAVGWDASILVVLDEREQVVPENLKHHAGVAAVRAEVFKRVKEPAAELHVTVLQVTNLLTK